jgi:KDO2-lipid IV(A) lauroyltransferase
VTPRDGAWSKAQRAKNDALYWTARASIGALLALPRAWLPMLGGAIGRLAWMLLVSARRVAVANFAQVNPSWSTSRCKHEARSVFLELGRCLADSIRLLDPSELAERTLTLDSASASTLERAVAEGRGVIYMTCHLAPWERMAALLSSRGYPITTVARESYDPRFHALLYDRLRERRGVATIYRGHTGAPFAIVRALRRGRVVGFLMDLPGRLATIDVVLLGQPARLPLGPLRIALRTGAPLVVGTPAPAPDGGQHILIERLPTDDLAPQDEAKLGQRVADALSARISALPTHWPWMHPSFTPILTLPDGAALALPDSSHRRTARAL